MRPSGRLDDQMRNVSIEPNVNKHAEGSCLIKFGEYPRYLYRFS